MTDMTIPAPSGSTDAAASQVTTQTTETTTEQVAPQAEKPAGEPQEKPEGDPAGDEQHKTWKEKRAERNRARWQEYKAAKETLPLRLQALEGEVKRLRTGQQPPDFSQITDPNEELAERTAWKVRQSQASDAEARLDAERRAAVAETQTRLAAAWEETVSEARQSMPDFDQVFTKDTPVHERAAPFIVESDLSAEIAYYLGKNRAEAAELFNTFETNPALGLMKLGRIEAHLSRPAPNKVSTAPKPAPVLSGGQNPLGFDPERASVGDMAERLKKAGIIR